MPEFDCIWRFQYDYLHSILLGVTRQLWDTWSTRFLTANDKRLINKRLFQIKPPKEIHRTPRMLKRKNKWKATEWRSWLLFYSVPCLNDILSDELLTSYKLFVKSIFILLSTEINEAELLQCEIDLLTFVHECQFYYGKSFMTFNLHSLLHAAESVRKNGPLWATSTFPFENNIYYLKQNVSSPKGVLGQIAKRLLQRNILIGNLLISSDSKCRSFCENMFRRRKEVALNFTRTSDSAVLIGANMNMNEGDFEVSYSRCIFNGTVLHSALYTRSKKSDNSYVYLVGNRIARMLSFFNKNDLAYAEVDMLDADKCDNLNHIYKIRTNTRNSTHITLNEIVAKLVHVSVDTNMNMSNIEEVPIDE